MTVRKIKSIGDIPYPIDVGTDALSPLLTAGAALGITGDGPAETAAWLQRTSTSDGPTTVKSIHGRTVRWNQHRAPSDGGNAGTVNGITWAKNADGSVTMSGTSTASTTTNIILKSLAAGEVPVGHKILIKGACPAGGSADTYRAGIGGVTTDMGNGGIWTSNISAATTFRFSVSAGATVPESTIWPQLFDLTDMFGAGSEPSTVEEFEALYPADYYPYDAGSLLPVNMAGVETVGANLWGGKAIHDTVLENVADSTDGANIYGNYVLFSAPRVSGKLLFGGPYKDNTQYTFIIKAGKNNTSGNLNLRVTYTDGTYSNVGRTSTDSDGTPETVVKVTAVGKTVARLAGVNSSGNTYLYYNGSGVFEGVHTANEFEPYWQQQRTIDVSTYYPQGMNGVSGFYDKLTETKAITRMHTVTLDGTQDNVHYLLNTSREVTTASIGGTAWTAAGYPEPMHGYSTVKLLCDALPTLTSDYKTWPDGTKGIAVWSDNSAAFVIAPTGDKTITTEDQFKAWLAQNPLTITYAVATPTVTTIDPPLNLTYRTEQGGTERVMVPTGETSAPPTIVTAQGYTAESLRDAALSAIAPVENGLASANYAVGAYLVHGGQLCKVTTAIATGEAISIGTNVTATTVMAEVLSLTQ